MLKIFMVIQLDLEYYWIKKTKESNLQYLLTAVPSECFVDDFRLVPTNEELLGLVTTSDKISLTLLCTAVGRFK